MIKMNKILFLIIASVVLLASPTMSLAQNTQEPQQQKSQDSKVQEATTNPQANQDQVQNQIQVQNQGEETQLRTATQQMEQLMEMEGLTEEVGEQVRKIAGEQVQVQSQIQTQLKKLEAKSNFMKRLFGPDYGAIKNLKQQTEQNRLTIQKLTQLKNQVNNEAEEIQLQEAIQALTQENTNLQEQIQAEEKNRSVFGWLVKLFYK